MSSKFLKDSYKKIKRRAYKTEHYHDPHELKVAKMLQNKKGYKKGQVGAALKLCLKPEEERRKTYCLA